jgi:CheY-like chemotaxis protein
MSMATVLVIDDNSDNRELMTYLLRAFGHEVVAAEDGIEGLEAAESNGFDLIVCDIHLPRMDGYGVLAELKARPRLAGIPCVAVTALAMPGDRDRVLAAGFDGYVAKPIDPETFVGDIERRLEAHAREET